MITIYNFHPKLKLKINFDNLYTTNISDLCQDKSNKYITFLDSNKTKCKFWVVMFDFVCNKQLPITTDLPCWWCRDSFETSPIGLPIRYHHTEKKIEQYFKRCNLPIESLDYFETEGLFCSFPCCKAYILDNLKTNPKYKNSLSLLTLLYYRLYNTIIYIKEAPSWKLIDRWGGHLSIYDYRSSFSKLVYTITPNIKRPFMFSTGILIEEEKV